jgi:hypothetical protein
MFLSIVKKKSISLLYPIPEGTFPDFTNNGPTNSEFPNSGPQIRTGEEEEADGTTQCRFNAINLFYSTERP